MRSTKEAELNFAVLSYIAKCLAEGDLRVLNHLGLECADARAIESLLLSDAQYLAGMGYPILRQDAVDRDRVARLVTHVKRLRERRMLRDELLLNEAPQPMMLTLFGMEATEYADLRRVLGVAGGTGRPSEASEDEEHAVWEAYHAQTDHADAGLELSARDYLMLHKRSGVPLRTIWRLVQRWIKEGVPTTPVQPKNVLSFRKSAS